MTYTMFAQWLGMLSILFSFSILLNLEYAHNVAKQKIESEDTYLIAGVLPVALGSLILVNMDCFEFCWHLMLTAAGMAILVAGIYRIFFVNHWKKFASNHAEYLPFLLCLFGLMLGVMLIYAGYFAKTVEFSFV